MTNLEKFKQTKAVDCKSFNKLYTYRGNSYKIEVNFPYDEKNYKHLIQIISHILKNEVYVEVEQSHFVYPERSVLDKQIMSMRKNIMHLIDVENSIKSKLDLVYTGYSMNNN